MTLQRDDLERAFSTFEMPEPAFERLAQRRRQKERRARMGATAVAVVVLAALVGAGLRALDTRYRSATFPTPVTQIPSVARVTCTGDDGEQLESNTVAVQPDGMRFEITQAHAGRLSQVWLESPDFGGVSVGFTDPDGPKLVSLGDMYLAPGTYRISCWEPRRPFFTDPSGSDKITFVDPEGYFLSTSIMCDDGQPTPGYNTLSLPGFSGGDPEPAVRATVPWLRPTDVFEPAGYAVGPWASYVITREGQPIARFMYDLRHLPDWVYFDGCDGTKPRPPQR